MLKFSFCLWPIHKITPFCQVFNSPSENCSGQFVVEIDKFKINLITSNFNPPIHVVDLSDYRTFNNFGFQFGRQSLFNQGRVGSRIKQNYYLFGSRICFNVTNQSLRTDSSISSHTKKSAWKVSDCSADLPVLRYKTPSLQSWSDLSQVNSYNRCLCLHRRQLILLLGEVVYSEIFYSF